MTRLFAPTAGPRIFALAPGVDFSRVLLEGLLARLHRQPPEALADVEIWVNTQRARRTLTALLTEGPPRLLPRIRVVTELAADPRAPLALPPAVPALRRKLELARLVSRLIDAAPDLAAETAAFDLADSLGDLLDEMQGAGVDPAALRGIDPAGHAVHWQRSLRFLGLIVDYARANGPCFGQGRQRAVAEAFAQAWADSPPSHPVLVAGSTGSRPATRAFMAAVARLPQGAVILPGFDGDLPTGVWRRLGSGDAHAADHPQYGFRSLADALEIDPEEVAPWHDTRPPAPARNALVSLALRPAPVTDQWRQEGAALAGSLAAALAGLDWIEAPDARAEARAIALALRAEAETGARAALITPDRTLARRVTAELDRWGLIPDDSAGRPLGLTPPGVLLRHVAEALGIPLAPAALLALLKHPLVASAPGQRKPHLRLVRRLELDRLRGGSPEIDWADLSAWAVKANAAAPDWIAWLDRTLRPLVALGTMPLTRMVASHLVATEALAAGPAPRADHGLWDAEAGRAAAEATAALTGEAEAFGPITPAEYRALLASLLAARDVPEAAPVTDPRIAIWGTLEARVQSADLLILGGLNEGIWPRQPDPDPWLSRDLRRGLGLSSPERQIGLSAHDFQQALAAGRVILSRATRDAEAPTVPSRWLLRLDNLLAGLGAEGAGVLHAARARGNARLALANLLDQPAAPETPARRPAPAPPAAARPAALSVTQIETLVRDPYAIYAAKVLRLRRLDPPGRVPDALERGSALHAALDAFVAETEAHWPPDAQAAFRAVVGDSLAATVPWPAVRAIWTARLDRAAGWFLDEERKRRARGRPAAREVRGMHSLDGLTHPFRVTAKADRIDATPMGYAIYDYKSGGIPSSKEARAFHLQLALEAAIAAAGGFDGLPPGPAVHLELIGLGSQRALVLDSDPAALAVTWARLGALIAHYQDAANGFVARLRPQRLTYASDYDHLSRLGEWADGDPPEGVR